MFMLLLNILCHNLVGYESSRGLGTKIAECGYETPKPGYESSGYEKSMGTKRLVAICPSSVILFTFSSSCCPRKTHAWIA